MGPRQLAPPRAVVLGVGNVLLGDEGVGVRGVELLERAGRLPPFARAIDGGCSTHELIGELEELELLVLLDAVVTGSAPGTLIRLEGDAIPSAFGNRLSPHQSGLNDLLANLRLLGRAPRRVTLLGVEPQSLALSLELSPPVAKALPALVERALAEVATLGA